SMTTHLDLISANANLCEAQVKARKRRRKPEPGCGPGLDHHDAAGSRRPVEPETAVMRATRT
ncbi:MAG: hypothetical protein KAX84_05860, partial [Burkholderiales bacterium]|nr:hypothetical protein [Burkholderiales bacterium]